MPEEEIQEPQPVDVYNEAFAGSVQYPYWVDGIQFDSIEKYLAWLKKRKATSKPASQDSQGA